MNRLNALEYVNDAEIPSDYTGLALRKDNAYYELWVDGEKAKWYNGTYFLPCRFLVDSTRSHKISVKRWWTAYRDHPKAAPILMALLLGED